MPLTVSCNALYFPTEAMDNVLTLQWDDAVDAVRGGGEAAATLPAYSLALYKLKCSAPQLFHVVPRYGALLLVDGGGQRVATCRATVTIGLHRGLADAVATDASAVASNASFTSSRTSATTMTLTRRRSARQQFAVECCLVTGSPQAYERYVTLSGAGTATATTASMLQAAKSVWTLVTTGELAAARVTMQPPLLLKVYMHDVVLPGSAAVSATQRSTRSDSTASSVATEPAVVVVPRHAQLVPSTLPSRPVTTSESVLRDRGSQTSSSEHATRGESMATTTTTAVTTATPAATTTTTTPHGVYAGAATKELLALKEQIRVLQQQQQQQTPTPAAAAASVSASPSNAQAPPLAEGDAAMTLSGRQRPPQHATAAAMTTSSLLLPGSRTGHNSNNNNSGIGNYDSDKRSSGSGRGALLRSDDVLMPLPWCAKAPAASTSTSRGVRVYVVLLVMFAVYVCAILARSRTWTPRAHVASARGK